MKNFLKENEVGVLGERRVTWKQVTTTQFDKRKAREEYAPSKPLNEAAIYYDIRERNKKVRKSSGGFDDFDF